MGAFFLYCNSTSSQISDIKETYFVAALFDDFSFFTYSSVMQTGHLHITKSIFYFTPALNQLVDVSGELNLSDFCCLIVYNTAKPLPLMSKLCFLVCMRGNSKRNQSVVANQQVLLFIFCTYLTNSVSASEDVSLRTQLRVCHSAVCKQYLYI